MSYHQGQGNGHVSGGGPSETYGYSHSDYPPQNGQQHLDQQPPQPYRHLYGNHFDYSSDPIPAVNDVQQAPNAPAPPSSDPYYNQHGNAAPSYNAPFYQGYDHSAPGSTYNLGAPLPTSGSGYGQDPFHDDNQPLLAHGQPPAGVAPPFAVPIPTASPYRQQNQQQQYPNNVGGFDPNLVGQNGAAMAYANNDDEDHQSIVRYGRIPQRQPRRYKTVKRVQLYHGNLVLDCQVPPKLLAMCPNKTDREFTHMRYTAATCDPDDFMNERYALRQILYDQPRRTELFLVLTMYNEDEILFCRTMHGVIKNIQHLCSRNRSKIWGADGWKKVVVCIVSDGRAKINSRTLSVLAAMGVYQDGVAKNTVAGKPVTAHIYEYTTQLSINPDLKVKTAQDGVVPVQVLFCLKEKNAKKINSHRWFFNAFAPILKPNICVLLDVGTQPGPTSIYKLWKTFDLNSNVGGACGEIVALKGKYFKNLLNPIVAAQNFEYKMSNILDKPFESVFGYITVLPGAFSAYRYIALQNNSRGEGPLKEYFKGETLHHDVDADLWTKNMYLAEDRILCWELVAKRGSAWVLHYQRSAYATTDVPDTAHGLIAQRRRWLNGSFFAALHSSWHFGNLYRSDHSVLRKFWLHIELFYQVYNMLFAWFGIANYFIVFVILTTSLADPSFGLNGIKYFNLALKYIYAALIVMCFLLALGNRPAGSKKTYLGIMVCWALITVYMLFAAVFITVKGIQNVEAAVRADGGKFTLSDVFTNSIFRNIVISLLSTYGLYLLSSIIFFDVAHLFTSFVQYMLLAPSYINVIQTYSFCQINDLTWGNRPEEAKQDLGAAPVKDGAVDVALPTDEKDINAAYEDAMHVLQSPAPKEAKTIDTEQRMKDSYANIRTNVVMTWALSNGALVAVILSTSAGQSFGVDGTNVRTSVYMGFVLYSVAALAAIRFIGSTLYTVMWLFQN